MQSTIGIYRPSLTLLTDLYQLTMAAGCFHRGRAQPFGEELEAQGYGISGLRVARDQVDVHLNDAVLIVRLDGRRVVRAAGARVDSGKEQRR